MFFAQQLKAPNNKVENWDYSKFVAGVVDGTVQKVTVQPDDRMILGKTKGNVDFSVVQPDDPNLNLTKMLLDNKVDFSTDPPKRPSSLWQIFINFGPVLVFVGFFIFMMRQNQGGGGGAMAFGKSRARLMTVGQQKITFADVAGVDEAKTELMEVVDYLKDPKKYQQLGERSRRASFCLALLGPGRPC